MVRIDTWTAEDDATLRRLWDEGWSDAQIGREIGRTPNAVVGRRHRLGVVGRSTQHKQHQRVRPEVMARAKRLTRGVVPTLPSGPPVVAKEKDSAHYRDRPAEFVTEVLVPPGSTRFVDLESWQCRWILDDLPRYDSACCSARVVEGLPYCASHCQMAYVGVRKRQGPVLPSFRPRGHRRPSHL